MNSCLDVGEIRESARLSRRQIEIVALCGGVAFLDGLDLISISFVGPVISKSIGFDAQQLGLVFATGLIGLAIGSLLIGPVSDARGRKPALLLSVLLFSVGTLLTAAAGDLRELLACRLLTGIGLGGATPVLLAVVTEACPRRLQAPLSLTMYCGVMMGGLFGAAVCAGLLESHGWTSVMWLGGILPLLYIPVLVRRLPESVEYLAARGGQDDQVGRLLQGLVPSFRPGAGTRYTVARSASSPSFRSLFLPAYAPRTLLTTLGLFCSLFSLFLYSSWLPGLLGSRGASTLDGIIATSAGQVGNLIGSLLLARLIMKMSPYRLIAITYVGAFIGLTGVAHAPVDLQWQVPLNLAIGFCLAGSQGALMALAPALFPPDVRTRGIGFARGVGQLGATLGPWVAGVMLAWHWGASDLLQLAAVPPLISAVACIVLHRITSIAPNRSASEPRKHLS